MFRSLVFASHIRAVLCLATLRWSSTSFGDDFSAAVDVLVAVGPEGRGHREAQAAWQSIANSPVDKLPELLAALDRAGPLGRNWLRSAVETIVDRSAAAGGKPPLEQLEKFIGETSHATVARRLAYEILARFDDTAPARLMPSFLSDPSTELRRESIERLFATADQSSDEAAKKTLYRQAFDAARDLDQIKDLGEKLEKLGIVVDLPMHFGFVADWKLIGPFDNSGEKGFDVAYPPEQTIDFSAKYPGKDGKEVAWIDHKTSDKHGVVDLNAALGKNKGAVAYALSVFRSQEARSVDVRVGSNNAVKLWVNGKLCDSRKVYHSGFEIDQYVSQAELKPGENVIMIKVCENEQTESWAQDWNFQLRICDSVGTAVLSADRVANK